MSGERLAVLYTIDAGAGIPVGVGGASLCGVGCHHRHAVVEIPARPMPQDHLATNRVNAVIGVIRDRILPPMAPAIVLEARDEGEMASSNRDEFTAKTKRDLAARAGHVCSYPGCLQPTSGPSAEAEDASVNLGEACHICAAAPGGPRYDPSMTKAERGSIDNGIWMCCNHAALIDADDATYTVEQLHQWKRDAVRRADLRLPRSKMMRVVFAEIEYDARHESAIRTLVAGFAGVATSFQVEFQDQRTRKRAKE